jgi:Cytochrome P450
LRHCFVLGIIDNSFDETFRRQHQVVLSILKEFGFGQEVVETRILTEVSFLVDCIRKKNGLPFCPHSAITNSVLPVILSIVVGHIMEQSATENVVHLVHSSIEEFSDAVELDFFPLMRILPRHRQMMQKVFATNKKLFDVIDECVSSCSEDSFIRHYINRDGSQFDAEQLSFITRDLLLAGTETSASTLLWSLCLLANYPDVQSKMQQEIDSVVPRNELPRLSNKSQLPYVEATMYEIMRFKTLVPLSLFHETKCDTTVAKFHVPAKTTVSVMMLMMRFEISPWSSRGKDSFHSQHKYRQGR